MKKECEKMGLCQDPNCRYFINWFETGNCSLKFKRPHTLHEIGVAFGVTRERARQVTDEAIERFGAKFKRAYRDHPQE